jgi:endo-1,4-beta-xylanase
VTVGTTRRATLGLGIALAAAAAAPGLTAVAPGPSLDRLARGKRRRFGSCIGTRNGFSDPAYRALITGECSLLVMENELKWGWLRPDPATFDFAAADRLLEFAEANRLAMRGHNLLWHHPQWLPRWVSGYDFGAHPAAEAARLVATHIATVCRRYGTRIHGYDVVNEAVDNHSGALRETAFSRAMGSPEAVLDLAFRTARENAPHAQLVYNDYMSWEPGGEAHRAGVLRLLEGFRKRGAPVDALGVQSHIGSGNNPGDPSVFGPHDARAWRRFLDDVTGMGYALLITEFDVNDRGVEGDVATRDREVAGYARAYLDLMLSYAGLGDILAWGLSDLHSWLQKRPPRGDGLPKRPCPYDANFQPKPLRGAMAAAFAGAASVRRG